MYYLYPIVLLYYFEVQFNLTKRTLKILYYGLSNNFLTINVDNYNNYYCYWIYYL